MLTTTKKPFLCLFILLLTSGALAGEKVLVVMGVAATGPNRLLGQPIVDFGPPRGTSGSELVGAFDPLGTVALPLTPDTPLSALLATVPTREVDPVYFNLPLREVPANVDNAGILRDSLPGQLTVGTFDFNQTAPTDPITLGDWLLAEGQAVFKCKDGNAPTADIKVRNLIPNRLYTFWAIFSNNPPGSGAVPFGGAPNVIMTDENGDGRLYRELNFCPLSVTPEGAQLDYIVVVLHSDQQVYAVRPTLPDAGWPPGLVAHVQMQFALSGTLLID
ncbi:MAG: hypothetical protein V3T83_19425 [Acidobacteriota bacterium]